jgi:hypothetical protein
VNDAGVTLTRVGPTATIVVFATRCAIGGSMLQEIPDLPAGVIGFEVAGKLEVADYTDRLKPAIDRAAEAGAVRFVIVFPEFEGIAGGAVWQDFKMGFDHWKAWKRIALVTDIDWMTHATHWFGWMTPGEVKVFPMAERAAAITWASSATSPRD